MSKRKSQKEARLTLWRDTIKTISRPLPLVNVAPYDSIAGAAESLLAKISPDKGPLAKAFSYFSLDHAKPSHRALLLLILVDVCFGHARSGRPSGSRKWDKRQYFLLGYHHDIVRREHPNIKYQPAAELIVKTVPAFKHLTAGLVRQRLPEAHKLFMSVGAEIAIEEKPKPKVPTGGLLPY